MSRNVELPDDVYSRIEAEASMTGSTVAQWIETAVPNTSADPDVPAPEGARAMPPAAMNGEPPRARAESPFLPAGEGTLPGGARTMADRLAGLIGIDSSERNAVTVKAGDALADCPLAKGGTAGDAMSKSVELPEAVYARVEAVAAAAGSTVAEVIAARFPAPRRASVANGGADPPRTLADRFEGLLGVVSLDRTDLSERHGELFAEGMEEKYRQGRL